MRQMFMELGHEPYAAGIRGVKKKDYALLQIAVSQQMGTDAQLFQTERDHFPQALLFRKELPGRIGQQCADVAEDALRRNIGGKDIFCMGICRSRCFPGTDKKQRNILILRIKGDGSICQTIPDHSTGGLNKAGGQLTPGHIPGGGKKAVRPFFAALKGDQHHTQAASLRSYMSPGHSWVNSIRTLSAAI